jgi:hypothetical protein
MTEDTKAHVYLCKRGHPGQPPHLCPYQHDVNDDDEYQCTCCDNCEQDCADDI